jgi:hypothetical protein
MPVQRDGIGILVFRQPCLSARGFSERDELVAVEVGGPFVPRGHARRRIETSLAVAVSSGQGDAARLRVDAARRVRAYPIAASIPCIAFATRVDTRSIRDAPAGDPGLTPDFTR